MSSVLQTYILPNFVANVIFCAHAAAVWEATSGPCGSVAAGKGSGSSALIFLAFLQADLVVLHFTL